jgi:hypothetical protein
MEIKKYLNDIYTKIFFIIGAVFSLIIFFKSNNVITFVLLFIILSILTSIIGYQFGKLIKEFKIRRFFYIMIIIFLFFLILIIGSFSLISRSQEISKLNIFSNECKEFPHRSNIPWYYIESDKCVRLCLNENGRIVSFTEICSTDEIYSNLKYDDVKTGFICCIPKKNN